MSSTFDNLFEPIYLAGLELSNRIVMAPMSRHRARLDGVPTADMVEYYRQRAAAGLILTEGAYPSRWGAVICSRRGCLQSQVDGCGVASPTPSTPRAAAYSARSCTAGALAIL
jgi:2,4-dienoyl-CoA reductase-like NADH-dependent reductase (Old Yellow Enzyme family)